MAETLWIPVEEGGSMPDPGGGTLVTVGDFCPRYPCAEPTEPSTGGPARWVGPALTDLLPASDISAVNLEGPIAGAGTGIPKNGPNLSVDPAFADDLPALGFNLALLANNHTGDFGSDGMTHTLRWCADRQLAWCGAGSNTTEAAAPAYMDLPDRTHVAFIAVCEREFGIAGDASPGACWVEEPCVRDSIRKAREKADVVVVAEHGGCEYVPFSPVQRRSQLRRLVEAGADLVLGCHPHTTQGWERWQGGLIFFSLGNFYFPGEPEGEKESWNWSVVVRARFAGRRLAGAEVIPVGVSPARVVDVCEPDIAGRRLSYLEDLSASTAASLPALWHATVKYLWNDRYRRHVAKSKLGFEDEGPPVGELQSSRLRALNMLRCESHRWALQTWLSIRSGDSEDLATPEIEAEFKSFLERMNSA